MERVTNKFPSLEIINKNTVSLLTVNKITMRIVILMTVNPENIIVKISDIHDTMDVCAIVLQEQVHDLSQVKNVKVNNTQPELSEVECQIADDSTAISWLLGKNRLRQGSLQNVQSYAAS